MFVQYDIDRDGVIGFQELLLVIALTLCNPNPNPNP
jgi:hypothetical protein